MRPSAFRLPWCLPVKGALSPPFHWTGARGTCTPAVRPRNGLMLPAAGPLRQRGAGLATYSGTRCGVVPGGSLQRASRAACAVVVLRVGTRSPMRLVSINVCVSKELSASPPGLFRADVDTSPCGSEVTAPGSARVLVCARPSGRPGRVGRAGLTGAFWCASPFLWPFYFSFCAFSAPSSFGLPCFFLRHNCVLLSFFPALGAIGLGAMWLVFLFLVGFVPRCALLRLFSGFPFCTPPFFSRRFVGAVVDCFLAAPPPPLSWALPLVGPGPGCPVPWRRGGLFPWCPPPPLGLLPCVVPAPGALGLGAVRGYFLALPPPLSPLRPLAPAFRVFGPGCLGLWRRGSAVSLLRPPPPLPQVLWALTPCG